MKQTIKDAGLGVMDLVERKDVEERYAQAKASPRPSSSSAGRATTTARPRPRPAVAAAAPPRPSQPRPRRMAQAPRGVRLVRRTGVRVVRNYGGVPDPYVAFYACDAKVEADVRRSALVRPGT